VVDPWS